jgi:serine protease AprX
MNERREISRKAMEQLMLGAGRTHRFTQDTPVLPDVWMRYAGVEAADAEKGASQYDDPQKLLLSPYRDAPTGEVRRELAARLVKRKGPKSRSRVIYNESTVAATLTFGDLLRVVLPMTGWWWRKIAPHVVDKRSFNRVSVRNYIALAIEDPEHPPTPPDETLRFTPDVLWLVRVVGALALLHGKKPLPEPLRSEHPDFRKKPASSKNRDPIWRQLTDAALDAIDGLEAVKPPKAKIYSVSLNRTAGPTIAGSTLAVKADAARLLFGISCSTLTWAVIDSGIDATHPAFRKRNPKKKLPRGWYNKQKDENNTRIVGTFDFTCIGTLLDPDADEKELPPRVRAARKDPAVRTELSHLRTSLRLGMSIDWKLLRRFLEIPIADYKQSDIPENDHGTHVAGILAGDWQKGDEGRTGETDETLTGICPDLLLYDVRVLGGPDGTGDEFNVMAALQFVRFLNATNDVMAVHGVNLSMSIPHDVTNFACGRTPVCDEAERVVNSGIVVVAAAGNQGYRKYSTPDGTMEAYSASSITDPGNADLVITVGATHRTRPHTYGVSYFSSRGPTGDGRYKPDLVAPGEKIVSPIPNQSEISKDGTSQAAPHVSGAAALLMARHNELVGRPARIKEILCETATDLGRERYFQGSGMLDILRALQSV